MADTNYEIYYRKKGSDRWMMDSRYGTTSKQEALDDAKELERQPDIDAVRVVREIHNAETNATRDTVIWTSSKLKGGDKGGGGPKRRDDDDDDGPSPAPVRRPAPVRSAAADDDEEEEEDDEADSGKGGWFKRKPKSGEDGEPVKVSGRRAYMVVVKFVIIVFVSFFIATVTTYFYQNFLA